MEPLPPELTVAAIGRWLPEIFPEGTPNRTYVIRGMAAKTLFVMFYAGAVEGGGRWLRPDQVTKMTDRQATRIDHAVRERWALDSVAPGKMKSLPGRWYAANTREPIRDETLRGGLVALGAVVERSGLPTTSAKPRYAVARDFADMLVQLAAQPGNSVTIIAGWQEHHLTAAALSRIILLRRGAIHAGGTERIRVTFPNGETRLMAPGPSTIISKGVIEDFAPRFLREPGVIFLSESGNKVVARDDRLAHEIGLRLDYSRNLPDIILVDVFRASPKVIFVEVVATDGAVTEQRKQTLLRIASDAGFTQANVYFLTAFLDRSAPAFRRLVTEIAWGTFAWFSAEPQKLIAFREGKPEELSSLFAQ